MVYILLFMCKQIIIRYGDRGAQGFYEAPSLDVMLLKQQVFSASGANQNREPTFQYAYRQHHPLLQYLPQKLAEWLAKNMSEELNLPDPGDEWSSEALNNILIHCLVSNRRGDNLHTFQCVEFESDLYRGVMRARCFPFNMEKHRFYGKNVKVMQSRWWNEHLKHVVTHLNLKLRCWLVCGVKLSFNIQCQGQTDGVW